MDRLKTALEQIQMSEPQQQRLQARLQQAAAEKQPQHKRRIALLAAGAACLLVATLLVSGLFKGEPELNLIAYAADQPGVVLLEGQTASFQIDGDFGGGSVRYGVFGDFGGGETMVRLRLVCQGDGVESITYSSEDCKFTEVLNLLPGDPLYDVNGEEAWEVHRFYMITGPGSDRDGNITHPAKSAYVDLGHSYSVAYDEQDDRAYLMRLPLYEAEPRDSEGRGGKFGAEDAIIIATITMENGRTYSKKLLLQAEIDEDYYNSLNYYFLPENFDDMSPDEQRELQEEAIEQGYNSFAVPGFDPQKIQHFPTIFSVTILED